MQQNELYHYGVKGMRWGHRKAQQYTARAKQLRKSGKKGDLGEAKAYETRAKNAKDYAKRNKKQAEVNASRTMGAKIATNIWAGPFANRTYNAVRAAGGSKGAALGITTATALIGGPLGHVIVAELYGHGAAGNR